MKKIAIAFAALSLSILAACGNPSVQACEDYVTHYNELECNESADLDAEDYCAGEDSCSRAEYWTCVQEGTTCDGDTFTSDIGDCDPACG